MSSRLSKSRLNKLKSNFPVYADQYGSKHFAGEDFFATQISRPEVRAEAGLSAFDPFTSSPGEISFNDSLYSA